MKVFISWSKELSRAVAEAFAEWLPVVIQECSDPYISTDTAKGEPWFSTITANLEGTKVGVLFITQENATEPWLNFEGGALYRAYGDKQLLPVLVGIKKSDYAGPLKNLQLTEIEDRADFFKFMQSLNAQLDSPLADAVLKRVFDQNWEQFEQAVAKAKDTTRGTAARPTERKLEEKVDELLLMVREISGAASGTPRSTPQAQLLNLLVGLRPELREAAVVSAANDREGRVKWFAENYGSYAVHKTLQDVRGEVRDFRVSNGILIVTLKGVAPDEHGRQRWFEFSHLDYLPF